jgi:GT2 family glycosyltransferase
LNSYINVTIVTYDNKDLLKSCITSVKEALDNLSQEWKVTVVNNASTDGTKELINKDFTFVNHIENNQNLGLSKALNIGINHGINSEFTLLLNDDVELFPDTISEMIDTLKMYPDAMGVPASLIYADGQPQRVKLKILGVGKKNPESVQKISFAGTTACLYRTEIFRKIGLFDEFYFFYNEDLDFCLRAKRNGMSFVFNSTIKVIHHRKKGRINADKTIKPYFYATDYYFYRKNFGILFSSVYLIMAYVHRLIWKKRFNKNNEIEKLELLHQGIVMLKTTRKNYKYHRNKTIAI